MSIKRLSQLQMGVRILPVQVIEVCMILHIVFHHPMSSSLIYSPRKTNRTSSNVIPVHTFFYLYCGALTEVLTPCEQALNIIVLTAVDMLQTIYLKVQAKVWSKKSTSLNQVGCWHKHLSHLRKCSQLINPLDAIESV